MRVPLGVLRRLSLLEMLLSLEVSLETAMRLRRRDGSDSGLLYRMVRQAMESLTLAQSNEAHVFSGDG